MKLVEKLLITGLRNNPTLPLMIWIWQMFRLRTKKLKKNLMFQLKVIRLMSLIMNRMRMSRVVLKTILVLWIFW